MMKAVITLPVVNCEGENTICNMIESMDQTFGRLRDRIVDLQNKGFRLTYEKGVYSSLETIRQKVKDDFRTGKLSFPKRK